MDKSNKINTRRRFMKDATLTVSGLSAFSVMQPNQVFGSNANSMVQMGIIGTGGRGQYDGRNLIKTKKVKVIALADYFDFQMEKPSQWFEVDKANCFDGLDGYKQILAMDEVDAVLLTTAPYFRPIQFKAAIDAGKHVFAEKPIAVDPWGCREFLASGEKANKEKITVGAGLQTRYDESHQKLGKMIHDGAIGDLVFAHSTRMGGDLWRRERPDHFSELDHQIRHWLYYTWSSGDFIVEMHVHNLDVFNWFADRLPLRATGTGGRDVRLDVGDIYDHISVIYEYPNGFHLTHTGSQIEKGYHGSVKHISGSEGYYDQNSGLKTKENKTIKPEGREGIRSATEMEMVHFVNSVLGEGPYINNSRYVTTSTFTAILGRTAAYLKEKVEWDDLWASNKRLEMPS